MFTKNVSCTFKASNGQAGFQSLNVLAIGTGCQIGSILVKGREIKTDSMVFYELSLQVVRKSGILTTRDTMVTFLPETLVDI